MKKLTKSSELLWIFGTLLVALGVSVCSKADLGVSMIAAPAFVLSEALSKLWSGFSVGVVEYLFQGLLLILLFILLKKFSWKFLLAFVSAVVYGYALNLFMFLFNEISFDAIWLRWTMLLVGDIITAFGVACFFRTTYPLQVYELFVAKTASRFNTPLHKIKSIFDIALLGVSVLLALTLFGDVASFDWSTIYYRSFHSIGLGTLLTTFINAPLISFTGKILDRFFENKPLFPKLENLLIVK